MAFKGLLSAVPVAELLEWALASSKTGALELENERFRKVVYLVDGAIVAIESTEPADSLARRLCLTGRVSAEQSAAAERVVQRTGRPLFDVLHRTGALDGAELEQALEVQVRDALLATFLWHEGRFQFREGEMPSETPAAVRLEVGPLAAEGIRLRERADALRAMLGGAAGSFHLAAGAEAIETASALADGIRRLLSRPQTVSSLMVETGAGEMAVLEALEQLRQSQALEVEAEAAAERSAASRAVVEAQAGGAVREQFATVVGILEPLVTPLPTGTEVARGLGHAAELLSSARREMESRRYEQALELFRAAERAEPGDSRLASLRAAAEAVHHEASARANFPMDARPLATPGREPDLAPSPLARTLLGASDGSSTVRELVARAGASELDALNALEELRRLGLVAAGRT